MSKNVLNNWWDNIDYSRGYDSEIEDRFRREKRYLELGDYLSHFRKSNPVEQREYLNEISQIKAYGRKYNALVDSAPTSIQKDAVIFNEFWKGGSIDDVDDDNAYKKEYNNVVDMLGKNISIQVGKGGHRVGVKGASTIQVSFDTKHRSDAFWGIFNGVPVLSTIADYLSKDDEVGQNQYVQFLENSSYSTADIEKITGAKVVRENGRVNVTIPKSNLNAIKLLSDIHNWKETVGKTRYDVTYNSFDEKGEKVADYDSNRYTINNLSKFLSKLSEDNQKVLSSAGAESREVSITTFDYMNERQKHYKDLADAGYISIDKAKEGIELDNQKYLNALRRQSFAQLDIYATPIEGGTLTRVEDSMQKGSLKNYISNAIGDKRVHLSAGFSDGEYGAYITVDPKDDKGSLDYQDDDSRRGMILFIPGLFSKTIQTAYNSSSKGKTITEITNMQKYGYDYELHDGNILKNVGNNSAILYDKNTKSEREITKEEAQKVLEKSFIIEDGINGISTYKLYNLNGNIREGYNPEQDIRNIALSAGNSMYGGAPIMESDVWGNTRNNSQSNVDRDIKIKEIEDIYSQIKAEINRMLNNNYE